MEALRFLSRKLSDTEEKYSTFDRELLAAFQSIRYFRMMLEGCHFQLWTDHNPLFVTMQHISPLWTSRQQRQFIYFRIKGDVVHCPGVDNVVADSLYRPASAPAAPAWHMAAQDNPELLSPPPPTPINYAEMAAVQQSWPDVAALCVSSSLSIVTREDEGQQLLGDVSKGSFRQWVPTFFKRM